MLAVLVITLVVSAAIGQVPAAPSRYQTDLARMLELGNRYSPRALTDARALHERLREQREYDARTQYAFALVLVQQRRPGDAVDVLEGVVAARPKLMPAWRTMLWASLSAHKYRDALTALRHVAELVGATDAEDRGDTAFFLGTVFGYLQGPRAGAVTEGELRRVRQKTLALLGDKRKDFEAGEEAFAAEFAELSEKLDTAQQANVKTQSQKLDVLKVRQKSVDEAEAENEYKTEKLKTDLKSELESLERQAQTVRTEITKNQYRAKQLEVAIITQQTQAQIQNMAMTGVNAASPQFIQARFQMNAIQGNLALLSNQQIANFAQISTNEANLAQLVQRRAELLGEKEQTSSHLRTQAVRLSLSEKQLRDARKLESKRASLPSRESRALRDRLQALATYAPFPFERERQIVLDWADPDPKLKPIHSAPTD